MTRGALVGFIMKSKRHSQERQRGLWEAEGSQGRGMARKGYEKGRKEISDNY